MLSRANALHDAYQIAHEAELVERPAFQFDSAAGAWLAAMHHEEVTGDIQWSNTETEREMQIAIEGILSGYARVSLLLFPAKSAGVRAQARGESLCGYLGIDADHAFGNRDLRNHWMHLDERLDAALERTGELPIGYVLARPGEF